MLRMSPSSALLRGIAGWRFAKRSRTDWLSLTFWDDSSAILIAVISVEKDDHSMPRVWRKNGESYDYSGGLQ